MNKQKIIVITGASSGIGKSLSCFFSKQNFTVILLARNIEAMKNLQLKNSFAFELDVTQHKQVVQCIEDIEKNIGPIEYLINNAGVGFDGDFSKISPENNESMVDVNLKGVINCISAVLPRMQERQSGTIINISSLADRCSRPNLATYAATKAAVKSLTESLRMANAKYGIRFCNISPAKIKTPLLKACLLEKDDIISVEHFAKMIFWITQQPQEICIRDIVIAPTKYEV